MILEKRSARLCEWISTSLDSNKSSSTYIDAVGNFKIYLL